MVISALVVLTFQRSPFWICVFKIPIKSMSKAVSNRIVNEIGNPLVVDTPKSGLDWGIFLHIRVDINITKPLTRGKLIKTTRLYNFAHFYLFCY